MGPVKNIAHAVVARVVRGRASDSLAEAQPLPAQVLAVVNELPPVCRAVLILHRRDGLSLRQISQQLGISPLAARQHLAAGLRHCCLRLKNFG